MFDWQAILERMDAGSVAPAEYAAYRELVVEGLAFFLDQLPAQRQRLLFLDQARLPADASAEDRLVALARLCPTLHKLGQVLARDTRLGMTFRARLQTLESLPPQRDESAVRAILHQNLEAEGAGEIELGPRALAEGSVAVVLPFRCVGNAALQAGPNGVFKVLKPGIDHVLYEELEILERFGEWLDEQGARWDLPPLDYHDVFSQVAELLRMEVRLDLEQRHLEEAGVLYERQSGVRIPRLFPFCTSRITAMERIFGRPVTDPETDRASGRREIASRLVEALLARPLWSAGAASLFHADPHAGNLFWTEDERLALLDWALVGRLSKQVRIQLTQLLLSAATFDEVALRENLARLAAGTVDAGRIGGVVAQALGWLHLGSRLGVAWLTRFLDTAVKSAGLSFDADLTLFRKSLHTFMGVLHDVDPTCQIDLVLAHSFARQWAWEWPERFWTPAWSRAFATHLSTLDVLAACAIGPWSMARYGAYARRPK